MIIRSFKVSDPESSLEESLEKVFNSLYETVFKDSVPKNVNLKFTAIIDEATDKFPIEKTKEIIKVFVESHGYKVEKIEIKNSKTIIRFE
ncbi:hypothetical protein LN42_00475 [Marinitoga sp. 1137]|uniref:hypothetical protein n=1 Tax=Marinitoga sp. 1137 TaxID=1545835 RepID=UPI00095071DB|nr:hypothetical protein [Marinitoga sp. 1137]APT75040.1 hypothetical protein LN42_00475 [Marinitoga sp. 1137]